jgi:DNA segregation ATPase FtsK/SpoIIIE-like protein
MQIQLDWKKHYEDKAMHVLKIVKTVLNSNHGTDATMVSRWVMTRTSRGSIWLFAVLDDQRMPRFEPYEAVAHRLSSSLRGMPVILSNHTGLRYGILLSEKPKWPDMVSFGGWKKGVLQLGVNGRGQVVEMPWNEIGHTLVAGITRYGKSNFLRLMVEQARAESWQLALCDPDGRTFGKFAGDPALVFPVARTLDQCNHALGQLQELVNERSRMFDQVEGSPDTLDEYNETAETKLKPVLVVLDEFNGTVMSLGGANGSFAKAATRLVWGAAKFGIWIVLAGQDFSKDIVGPVREQMMTRICFRVANAQTSRMILGRSGAELLDHQGRVMSNRWGTMQVYFVPKGLIASGSANGLTEAEQRLADYLRANYDGKMTITALQAYGMPERSARRIREDWHFRGLAVVRPDRDNALCLADLSGSDAVRTDSGGSDAVRTGSDALGGSDGFQQDMEA